MIAEPTIGELLDIASQAVKGSGDKNADFIRGSDYESLLGPSAIIWSRLAQRDTDLFNSVNFNTADGQHLTELVWRRYQKARVLDTRGTGTATLTRSSTLVSDTIWKGTTICLTGPHPRFYRVTADKAVSIGTSQVVVDIEAVQVGPGSSVQLAGPGARVEDTLKDTWTVATLTCGDGTLFEAADEFRARVRRERLEERVGLEPAIIKACKEAGAYNVILFRSNFAGDAYDYGLNYCYVSNLGFGATDELVKACFLALRSVRVAGDNLQVLPTQRVALDITADVYLYDSPVNFDLTRLERIHGAALQQYLNGASGRFSYSLDGIRTALAKHTPEVQRVVVATPSSDDNIAVGPRKNFPSVLNRYVPGTIFLRYKSP